MAFNLKVLALAVVALGSLNQASAFDEKDPQYFQISKMQVQEVTADVFGHDIYETVYEKQFNQEIKADPIEQAGKVISVARDLVALGEDIYKLVIKGKPTNTTTYAPIVVVPKVGGEPVDPLDIEGTSLPIKKTYRIQWKNLYNANVVTFTYSVMWAYGGSYEGKGAYLSHIQIIPESIRTLWGFDFSATMKLGGIQNLGTRSNPVAAATILLEYSTGNVMNVETYVDSYVVTGKGGFKKL